MQATMRPRSSWFWSGEEPEWLVVLTVLVALTLGALVMTFSTGQTTAFRAADLGLRYPLAWSRSVDEESLLTVRELGSANSVKVSVLRTLDPQAPVTMDALVTQLAFNRAQDLELYRVLTTRTQRVNGKSAVAVNYAYVMDPSRSAYQSALPVVVRGVDYIVPYKGKAYVFSLEAKAQDYDAHLGDLERVIESVRFY